MLIIGDVIMLVMWEGCPTHGIYLTAPKLFGAYGPTAAHVPGGELPTSLMMVSPFKPPKKWLEMMNPFKGNPISRWWFQICSNIFVTVTQILGEMIQFDRYFSNGWLNHQLAFYFFQPCLSAALNLGMVEKLKNKTWKKR